MYILEHAIKGVPASAQQAWQALLQLLALLEDFALHLVQVSPECLWQCYINHKELDRSCF